MQWGVTGSKCASPDFTNIIPTGVDPLNEGQGNGRRGYLPLGPRPHGGQAMMSYYLRRSKILWRPDLLCCCCS